MAQMPKTVRVSEETWISLRSLTEYGGNMDKTIQKLIIFYLNTHAESKKEKRRKEKQ